MTAEQIATSQGVPVKSLENILLELKRADLVLGQRGIGGGYRLARAPESITLADVVRVINGPLVTIQGQRPESAAFTGSPVVMREVWIAVELNVRAVLETVTLDDPDREKLPTHVEALLTAQQPCLR